MRLRWIDARMGPLFVQLHEAAMACDIARHHRRETTRRHPARPRIAVPGSLGAANIANVLARMGVTLRRLKQPTLVKSSKMVSTRKIPLSAHQRAAEN